MADVYDRERTLLREITPKVEGAIPGVEVLALELSGPERFPVYIDHPRRVEHAGELQTRLRAQALQDLLLVDVDGRLVQDELENLYQRVEPSSRRALV